MPSLLASSRCAPDKVLASSLLESTLVRRPQAAGRVERPVAAGLFRRFTPERMHDFTQDFTEDEIRREMERMSWYDVRHPRPDAGPPAARCRRSTTSFSLTCAKSS